jgi:hypothetical protein
LLRHVRSVLRSSTTRNNKSVRDGKKAYAAIMLACSVCSLPHDVLAAVNAALSRHEKLRKIAEFSGRSKSALSRHSITCLPRAVMLAHKAKSHAAANAPHRLIVDWRVEGSRPRFTLGDKPISASELKETDVLLVVHYQKIAAYKNPRALTPTPEILDRLRELANAEDRERAKQSN